MRAEAALWGVKIPVRYIIYGAGAIGGVIGARLHKAGKEVILIARGDHFEALRRKGLTLETPEGTETLRIPVVSSPAELTFTEGDVVFLCMKSQDTVAALEVLRAAGGDDLPLICTQNGVANERMALRRFEKVYAMVVMLPATHLEPGVVQQNSAPVPGILDIGRFPAGTDPLTEKVASHLNEAGFSSQPDPKVMRLKYTKLLLNLGNAFQVICGIQADGRDILRMAREEALACYHAAGMDYATDEEFRRRRGDFIRIPGGGDARRLGSSSWQSVFRGKEKVEADWLNGEICLLGRLYSIPTPVNRLLQNLADQVARKEIRPGSLTPEEIRRRLSL
jgi:2-dehydropantoate 2-reductase